MGKKAERTRNMQTMREFMDSKVEVHATFLRIISTYDCKKKMYTHRAILHSVHVNGVRVKLGDHVSLWIGENGQKFFTTVRVGEIVTFSAQVYEYKQTTQTGKKILRLGLRGAEGFKVLSEARP